MSDLQVVLRGVNQPAAESGLIRRLLQPQHQPTAEEAIYPSFAAFLGRLCLPVQQAAASR